MAELDKNHFKEEVLTELSWLRRAVSDIAEKLNVETYETALLRYHIEMEEAKAIDKFIFFNATTLDALSEEDIVNEVAKHFFNSLKNGGLKKVI